MFKKRTHTNNTRYIGHYEALPKLKIGDHFKSNLGKTHSFYAYLEKLSQINQYIQRVILQHEDIHISGPEIKSKRVAFEYLLPLNGRMKIDDFLKGKGREYEVTNQ